MQKPKTKSVIDYILYLNDFENKLRRENVEIDKVILNYILLSLDFNYWLDHKTLFLKEGKYIKSYGITYEQVDEQFKGFLMNSPLKLMKSDIFNYYPKNEMNNLTEHQQKFIESFYKDIRYDLKRVIFDESEFVKYDIHLPILFNHKYVSDQDLILYFSKRYESSQK